MNRLTRDSHDGSPDPDPQTWPAIIWRIIRRRPLFVVLILFGFYFTLRLYNIDLLEPAIERVANQLSLPAAVANPSDISGVWEYTCTDTTNGTMWGGIINIELKKEGFKVNGRGTWKSTNADISNRRQISPAIQWDAEGAAVFTSQVTAIQWRYFTHENENSSLEGVTYVVLEKQNGSKMNGHFSDVFVKQPRFGYMELTKK